MKRLLVLCCVLVVALAVSGQAGAAVKLNFYRATVSPDVYRDLLAKGADVAEATHVAKGVRLELVLTPSQVRGLEAQGADVSLLRNSKGQTARQAAAAQLSSGFQVWRDYDGPDGLRAYLYDVARRNPQLAKLEVIGTTGRGREILALKLTQAAREVPDGTRPAVLYTSMQHAREWISPEVNRRLLAYLISQWRANDRATKNLLKENELWFVLVANPDGYQYTFQSPDTRLWRKNLRDNNENGTIEVGDGVDPNRNYPEHFKYDEEGSSSIPSSDTYRGPGEGSEPETRAIVSLYDRVDFAFHVNWHSAGQWLLYAEGWQTATPTADDPIYFALSGNLDNPAIEDFHPGLSSDVLYVTNGETTDYAHSQRGTLAWTPELSEGCPGCGFVFPDNEALVQEEFERNLPFALDVAKSASDPDDPVSHLGIETKPFYLKSDDTYKTGLPLANFTFDVSYGDPQEVRVLAKRALGDVTLMYSINGGAPQSAPTEEWNGGERYGGQTDVYYHIMSGTVTGTSPGDSVEVWFEGGGETSESFTYTAAVESDNDVLILANEDYTGASPVYADQTAPNYLSYYAVALDANGIGYDVYDVDARGRKAATALGVLSHYDAVVWYTGDDIITREPGWAGGNASRLAMDQILNVREYLNEGGNALWAGKHAGLQHSTNQAQLYDPTAANAQCGALPPTTDPRRCLVLHGSGDLQGDVLEYWFGGFLLNNGAGLTEDNIFDVLGVDTPFDSLTLTFNGADSAQNGDNANSFIATSGILPPDEFPQFESWVSSRYDRPGGPFDPHTGESYAYSQIADVSFKSISQTTAVPSGGGDLTFWTSYNTEPDWDFLFVEVAPAGTNNWTTLPDANGHTTQNTGQSCLQSNSGGWRTLHPWLDRYQTQNTATTCLPTGTTGAWNAASGDSGGWQEWNINLNAYAGQQVEIRISYASDWASQGLGVFIDDVTLPDGSSTSFEGDDTGGWVPSGPPPGSAPNVNNFVFTTAAGFPEGATITTEDSLLFGFGLEAVTGADARADVMGRAMDYLLGGP
jgi:Zinc carboxypeptidase